MSFAGYFLSVLFCMLSMLISDSRFDLVWFRLSCDHGWIRSGSVNVRKQQQQQLESKPKKNTCDIMIKLTRYNSFDQSDKKIKYLGGTLTTPACPSNGWCVEFTSSNFHEDRR